MSEYLWNKNITFTWISSLYNPFKWLNPIIFMNYLKDIFKHFFKEFQVDFYALKKLNNFFHNI